MHGCNHVSIKSACPKASGGPAGRSKHQDGQETPESYNTDGFPGYDVAYPKTLAGNDYMPCATRNGMVVKSVRGRRRYIYFRIPAGTHRDDLTAMIGDRIASAKVITCHRTDAVVRCLPQDCSALTGLLSGPENGCESVKTSGTLRTLRDEYPQLRVPQHRKK